MRIPSEPLDFKEGSNPIGNLMPAFH
jgi:hypothetical protein